jgi:hypothetical protein
LPEPAQVIVFKGTMEEAAAEVTKPLSDILKALEQVQKLCVGFALLIVWHGFAVLALLC